MEINLPLLLLLSCIPCFVSLNLPGNETDLLSLLSLKEGIIRDPTGVLSRWNETTHFCAWEGVTCGEKHPERVTALDLSSLGLAGTVSPSIGNLTFLKMILLANNGFYGELPPGLCPSQRLQYLNLSLNSFQGEIPANLSFCSELVVLDLNSNQIIGKIPKELGSLRSLDTLGLFGNNLSGVIPQSISNLTSLTRLSLGSNRLVGGIPEELGRLRKPIFLSLGSNTLSGTIPVSIFNLSSLYFLGLGLNLFNGSLPASMGITLPNLEYLYLAGNEFDGPIPVSLSNATGILQIDMPNNKFTGRVPPDLGRLQYLFYLNLNLNQLVANDTNGWDFLTSLTNCTNLIQLHLADNNLGGNLPSSIANLSTQLQQLALQRNQISGTIASGIENLVSLAALAMHDNLLTGIIPDGVGKLRMLQWLGLYGNRLTGHIPSSLGNLTQLLYLGLADNDLKGSIPPSLGNLQQLNSLYLSNNALNGTIPKEIVSISSLSYVFDLSDNSLVGYLPVEIGRLKNLEALYISGNKLFGEVPDELGNCQSLEYLRMGNNFFQGSIPPSLSNMKGLQELDLSQNNLSGHIPGILGSLRVLNLLNLSYNHLEGEVPMKGVFQNTTAVVLDGNRGLCGGISQLHLPTCPKTLPDRRKSSVNIRKWIYIPISAFVIIFILMFCFAYFYWKRSTRKEHVSVNFLGDQYRKVSYGELAKATDQFSSANLVGTGSYGSVYKATLGDATVAVKVIDLQGQGAPKSFFAECEALKGIRHRNIVKILTSCSSSDSEGNDFKALVFEFMPNGSLDEWLHGEREHKLSLVQRIDIAIDVAVALSYLHHDCQDPLVHCDLKPSNVLLDNDMVAHVSDFGLAKMLPQAMIKSLNDSSGSIGIRGSIGYIAPEYGAGVEVSTSGDVYSFGILLLELLTGKKPVSDVFKDGISLHSFVRMAFPNRILEIVDPQVLTQGGEIVGEKRESDEMHECLSSLVRIGLSCSKHSPRERMSMNNVAVELHKIRDVPGLYD